MPQVAADNRRTGNIYAVLRCYLPPPTPLLQLLLGVRAYVCVCYMRLPALSTGHMVILHTVSLFEVRHSVTETAAVETAPSVVGRIPIRVFT